MLQLYIENTASPCPQEFEFTKYKLGSPNLALKNALFLIPYLSPSVPVSLLIFISLYLPHCSLVSLLICLTAFCSGEDKETDPDQVQDAGVELGCFEAKSDQWDRLQ